MEGSGGPVADDPGAAKPRLVAVGVDSRIDAFTPEISTSVEECTVYFVTSST